MKPTNQIPLFISTDPDEFWSNIRSIIREEINSTKVYGDGVLRKPEGLVYKPLFKMVEVCQLFKISKPTVYEWVKAGKLFPKKIRSRVFFLWSDLEKLIALENQIPIVEEKIRKHTEVG